MDYAFYNEPEVRGVETAALTPLRRALRRVFRPTFYRLRDLLVRLDGRVADAEQGVADLRARLDQAKRANHELADRLTRAHDALQAALKRVAAVEAKFAAVEGALAEVRQGQELARPLEADYKALARRVDGVEDQLVRSLARPGRAAA